MRKALLLLLLACGACTAPEARRSKATEATGAGLEPRAVAEAPEYQRDPRPQREQDLETLGRWD